MVLELHAKIALEVAAYNGISASQVKARLFSQETMIVAPVARKYAAELGKIKRSGIALDVRERVVLDAWLRRFHFSNGDTMYDQALTNDADWLFAEVWKCWSHGKFEIEVEALDMSVPTCPICSKDMHQIVSDIDPYLPHVPEFDQPYETDDLNDAFLKAQDASYSRDDFGQIDYEDDSDIRDVESQWAEYLEAEGMSRFFDLASWDWLMVMTSNAINFADKEGWVKRRKWDFVRQYIRPALDSLWLDAYWLYLDREVNVVAMALIVHRLVSATRFSQEEMVERTKALPAYSHVDGQSLGYSLYEWMCQYQGEVDELAEDIGYQARALTVAETVQVAETWARRFDRQYLTHWAQQLGGKPEREGGKVIWASAWTNRKDILYNYWKIQAIISGTPPGEIESLVQDKIKEGWIPNLYAAQAKEEGLILKEGAVLEWRNAAQVSVKVTEPILEQMRALWKEVPRLRQYLNAVAKA